MDKALIFEIIEAFSSSSRIDCLRLEAEGLKIELESRRGIGGASAETPSRADLQSLRKAETLSEKSRTRDVKSPIVGTFYERSTPEAAPYVSVGQRVTKGDVLCIVEAMKMMNEIECDADGVVSEILIKNGDMVEFDQIIMRIEED